MAQWFISYSRKDEEFAKKLAATLSELGAEIWRDKEGIRGGENWGDAIQDGLDKCEVMILVISPDSMASPNVAHEWQYFLDERKSIFPVLRHPAEIPYQLRRIQRIDFQDDDNYDRALQKLLMALLKLGASAQPIDTSPITPKTEPVGEQVGRRRLSRWWVLVGVALVIIVAGGLLFVLKPSQPDRSPTAPGYPEGKSITCNSQWTPLVQVFDGVDMVLVPKGCFEMGYKDGSSDEKPVQSLCFETPFWIDRYEVTNAQFAQFDGQASEFSDWTGDQQPREQVTWFEARDFCQRRDARLPTEAEWEFAARGPNNLIYPWGDDFLTDNAVYRGNAAGQPAEVGSRSGSQSWVGAFDMSGNVWEWVNSIFAPYPYAANDGRESDTDTTAFRVRRGGAWTDSGNNFLRGYSRAWNEPEVKGDFLGIRCARDYQETPG